MPVRWQRLSDIGIKTEDFWNCNRCLEPTAFEDCWTVRPLSVAGFQLPGTAGYIHCGDCQKVFRNVAVRAWMEAHAKDPR